MKILVASPAPMFPTTAGNRARIAGLVDGLRQLGHDVHFAFLRLPSSPEAWDAAAHAASLGADHVHVLDDSAAARAQAFLGRVRRRLVPSQAGAFGLDDWVGDALVGGVADLDRRIGFDAVIVEYVFASGVFGGVRPGVRRILDTHDTFGERHERYRAMGQRAAWFSTSLAEEERGFRRADIVLAIQEHEAADFRERLGADAGRVRLVSHLLAIGAPRPVNPARKAVFLGSANRINQHGVAGFAADILPRIVERLPDFRLVLAGGISAIDLDSPHVERLGFVASPDDAYVAGRIAVNPVRMGTGISIKMLDALSAGVPTVSTRTGARGFDGIRNGAIVVVDDEDAEGFAAAVVGLLTTNDEAPWRASRESAVVWNRAQLDELARSLVD